MRKYIKHTILFCICLATIVLVDVEIYRKEMTLSTGRIMLLELAPVDPRSLMQGDYMMLRYKAAQAAGEPEAKDGNLVMFVEEDGIASFRRMHRPGEALAPGEHLLRYRKRGRGIRLGAESFFFQEGQAGLYIKAKYGELRVADTGESVLAGLRGQNLERLGPDLAAQANLTPGRRL